MFTYGNKNWGRMPTAGELNQRIEIVSAVAAINENGYHEMHDESICTAWAQVIVSGDSTMQAAGAQAQASAMNFVIRYREGIECGMTVLFEGKRYEIVALSGFDHRKRFLGMKTVTAGVIGG